MQLKMGIAKYSDSTTLSELQSKCPELNAAVSDAVTKSLGMSCTVKIAMTQAVSEQNRQAAPRPKFCGNFGNCGNCGSALAGGRFCPNCGKPV